MPRLANDGAAVDEWYRLEGERDGNGSSTFDLCQNCADSWEESLDVLEPYNGDPKGDLLTDGCCAPCYEDLYQCGEPYECDCCGVVLRKVDN